MSFRSIVQTAVVTVSVMLVACETRPTKTDAGTGGGAGGGAGGGGGTTVVDSGTLDAGMADAGSLPLETIGAAKGAKFPALVDLKGVVVTAVSFAAPSVNSTSNCFDSATKGVTASFWVADPNAAHSGIFVKKYRCDKPYDYVPAVGDVLDLKGYIGIEESFDIDREKKRFVVKQQFDFIFPTKPARCELSLNCQPLDINKTGTVAALPDNQVDATFGEGGAVKANSNYSGSRVKITGPLTLSDPRPLALKRVSLVPGDDRYFGFQLSNGVLVNNFLTYATFAADGGLLEDGGTSGCDYRLVALDGGTVSFASVSGIWDSYTYLGCVDGGIDSRCFKNYSVPGTDAGTTNVLYPMSCRDFQLQ